jgi:His-Xaa-Ser system protein HxsD
VSAEVVVAFAAASQAEGPLREAAYRLIGSAQCQIDLVEDAWRCRLRPARPGTEAEVEARFLDLVTDENLRAKVAGETGAMRDLIVSLAFGALAAGR